MTEQQNTPLRLIRMAEVLNITGLSKTSVYDHMSVGAFPKNVPIGGRAVAWVESEVYEWVETQIASREVI